MINNYNHVSGRAGSIFQYSNIHWHDTYDIDTVCSVIDISILGQTRQTHTHYYVPSERLFSW